VNRFEGAGYLEIVMILLVTSLGVFIAQFDSQVVNLALKHIGSDLDAGVSQLQWIMDSYNLLYATLLLTGGTLADLYGRTRIFVAGIGLIVAGSIVCTLAPNAGVLIAGRAITGVGAALNVPTSLAILTVAYANPKERARALGIWASCNGLATAVGPTIGGLTVDAFGWRGICALVIPFCLVAMAMAWKYVPETSDAKGRSLDLPGQALAITALGALCYAAIEAPHIGWASPLGLASVAIFAAATAAFFHIERGKQGALVPLDLFRNTEFNAALAGAAAMTFGMYAMLFLTPLYLQNTGHTSAFMAAVYMLPASVTFFAVSQINGWLSYRLGARVLMTGGLACMGSGLVMLAFVSTTPDLVLVETAMLIIGAGLGLNTAPVNAVAVASVPAARSGTASGLINTARMIGATLGVAVLGAIYAIKQGGSPQEAQSGLRLAYLVGGCVELAGAAIALLFIRADSMEQKDRAAAAR
jgi:EmrB/QacA subfamily drug resistance transporter